VKGGGEEFLLVGLKLKTLCEDLVPILMFFNFHLVESFGAFVSFLGGVGGGRVRGLFLGCWVGWFWGARAGGRVLGILKLWRVPRRVRFGGKFKAFAVESFVCLLACVLWCVCFADCSGSLACLFSERLVLSSFSETLSFEERRKSFV